MSNLIFLVRIIFRNRRRRLCYSTYSFSLLFNLINITLKLYRFFSLAVFEETCHTIIVWISNDLPDAYKNSPIHRTPPPLHQLLAISRLNIKCHFTVIAYNCCVKSTIDNKSNNLVHIDTANDLFA